MHREFDQSLPEALLPLKDLALDLRWTWSHAGDQLWRYIDRKTWQQTRNPYAILQATSNARLNELAGDTEFLRQLEKLCSDRRTYLDRDGWYQQSHANSALKTVAFFSMEYGLGEALPFYAGGLGILSGDYLKAASDLDIPMVAVGLLFHQGYFRQMLDDSGWQLEFYPSCDTASLPIAPARSASGEWLMIPLDLPGRRAWLRVWRAQVGRVPLYLLDSNHHLNNPLDRGITNQLYPAQQEKRFLQQLVLGVGGWRTLMALSVEIDVCHLNESHCAFAVLERLRHYSHLHDADLEEALLATRAGNIFTTHTPLPAASDSYDVELAKKYLSVYARSMDVSFDALLQLGMPSSTATQEKFYPMQLALKGSIAVNAVSRTHRFVTQRLFRSQFPRWPDGEIPLSYITNGVHVPTWDSPWADKLWTEAAGKERWLGGLENLPVAIAAQSDQQLWDFKCRERADLVDYVRRRFAAEVSQRGADENEINRASSILDPNILTLGFARRFTEYKRPNLLLHDFDRLRSLLAQSHMPVQLILAGKAHPTDVQGKHFIQQWIKFVHRNGLGHHVVFLADYDIALAQEMVQGVDVWINTPRYSWEACGTSGMKILANGGLNLSERDGWWAEAYQPNLGWAIGDGQEHCEPGWDAVEAQQLYHTLEHEIVPEFYARDEQGLPRQWIARMRASMVELAAYYSSNRMAQEYVESIYLPTAQRFHQRLAEEGKQLAQLRCWHLTLQQHWHEVHFGDYTVSPSEDGFVVDAQVYLGGIPADAVQVQLYADVETESASIFSSEMSSGDIKSVAQIKNGQAEVYNLEENQEIAGTVGGYHYKVEIRTQRPSADYSLRVIGRHSQASIPMECALILWRHLD